MPISSSIRVSRGFGITILREVRKLLEFGREDTLECVFKNMRTRIMKVGGDPCD